ncbi:unnamed protein product [marine sediment metagenome]|uniref:Uncharacterized protein n=1 Tax=marine sediment metagenome TaxID=412755 RepID=X0ZQ62_9ZZZZ
MTMKRILVLAILAVLISFSGCASLKPFESVDNIPDGQGLVYFYSELSKKMVSMYVTSDETLFGKYTGGFAFNNFDISEKLSPIDSDIIRCFLNSNRKANCSKLLKYLKINNQFL